MLTPEPGGGVGSRPGRTSISLLMPCYNGLPFLADALASAVSQLGPDDELVVQDACSDDGSAELLDQLAARDGRVRVRHERDHGQSDALNRALGRARGEFVGWLNADDLLLPGALAAVRAARSSGAGPVDLVIGRWHRLRSDGSLLRSKPAAALSHRKLLLKGCYVFSGAVFVRRSLLVQVGGFRTSLEYVMDYELMLRLAAATPTQALVDAPLAAFRMRPGSKTMGGAEAFGRESSGIRRRTSTGWTERAISELGIAIRVLYVKTESVRWGSRFTRVRGTWDAARRRLRTR